MLEVSELDKVRSAMKAAMLAATPERTALERARSAQHLRKLRALIARHRLPYQDMRAFAWANFGRTHLKECSPNELSLMRTLAERQATLHAD